MRKLLFVFLVCLPALGQVNNNAIIYADQYSTMTYQQIVDNICPTAGCTIYATSPNASRTIGTLDPGSKVVTIYLGPFTYNVNYIILRFGFRVIGMGATPLGTILQSTNTANDAIFKLPQSNNTPVEDVYLYGLRLLANGYPTPPPTSAQIGILLDCSNLSNSGLWHSTFEDLQLLGFRGAGLFFNGPINSVAAVNQLVSLRNIEALRPDANSGPDLRMEGANGQIDCIECHFDGPGGPTSGVVDQWTNVFIGNLSGGTQRPYSIHFFNLSSQFARTGVQIKGAQHLTFVGSHHEDLVRAYEFINPGGTVGNVDALISNASFAGNVGRATGGALVYADNASNVVLDTPFINGGGPAPTAVLAGTSAGNVSIRNAYNFYTSPQQYSTFAGDLNVVGTLTKSAGSFRIDHPLDPENKYLSHSFVESPDMKNIYDGIATLDAKGRAHVRLPDYFEALNQEFRYQLTCLGGYSPVYVSQEIKGNSFRIAGGKPGLKVSWQVTGIRHDGYANAHRITVEQEKPPSERGHFADPDALGKSLGKSNNTAVNTGGQQ